MAMENRFRMLGMIDPDAAKRLTKEAQEEIQERWTLYEHMASQKYASNGSAEEKRPPAPQAEE